VRGKLVPQDPKEGTGDELLERINAAHPPDRKFGSGRKKGQPQIDPLNCPELFSIPPSWRWAYLDFVCEQITDVDHNMPKAVDKGIPFISAKEL
jgi:type I restriction enzyme S subunit